jgi:hypothetical protein
LAIDCTMVAMRRDRTLNMESSFAADRSMFAGGHATPIEQSVTDSE